ncbi:MAG: hypothetical protein J6B34_00205 [Clostridia bacterium]|nr:hypothetical protein [Clostridia bacterium]
MKGKLNNYFIFLIGATGYALIEIAYRGWTHTIMMLLGGISFLFIYHVNVTLKIKNHIKRGLFCAFCVILVEMGGGIIFNIYLKMGLWSYESELFSFLGQICLKYFLMWLILSLFLYPICTYIKNKFG